MHTEQASIGASPDLSTPPVLISLSAFGAAEVRRRGQLWFAELSLAAGADGVEVRSELLQNAAHELPAIAQLVQMAKKTAIYSCADGLWRVDSSLDTTALQNAIWAAQTLGAKRIKMSMGGFGPGSHQSLDQLHEHLQSAGIELLIENDQTETAGTLAALQIFFATARMQGFPVGMTFDMGNWHWTGECPLQAAAVLAPQVRYIHCKGVQRQPHRWVAVPLTQSSAPWRAILRGLPRPVPWAIEYPLLGDDLNSVVCAEINQLKQLAKQLSQH